MFTRRRNSKKLQWRGTGGRFERATTEKAFGMSACNNTACGRFFQSVIIENDEHGFPDKKRITVCPHCGTDQREKGTADP